MIIILEKPMQSDTFIYIIIIRISKFWIFIIQRSMKMQQLEILEGLESAGYLELEGIIKKIIFTIKTKILIQLCSYPSNL